MSTTEDESFATQAETIVGELEGGKPSPAVRAALAQTYATLAVVEAIDRQTATVAEVEGRLGALGDDLGRSIDRSMRRVR